MTPVMVATGLASSGKTTLPAALPRDLRLHDTAVILDKLKKAGLAGKHGRETDAN